MEKAVVTGVSPIIILEVEIVQRRKIMFFAGKIDQAEYSVAFLPYCHNE
ncbi:hypothetical protein [Bacillus sp. ISL-45]|nr:hypothetical protein [Bacillus sp. ISL-45]MBT2640003.1 hypothetical protein [Bacillus sp. ISL-39]